MRVKLEFWLIGCIVPSAMARSWCMDKKIKKIRHFLMLLLCLPPVCGGELSSMFAIANIDDRIVI